MDRMPVKIRVRLWIVLVPLLALALSACDFDDARNLMSLACRICGNESDAKAEPGEVEATAVMPTEIPTVVPPTATVEPTVEPSGDAASEPPAPGTAQVNHPAGTGACAARQVTMGGTFTMCLSASCDVPLDSGHLQYKDKTEVGGCTEEGLIGVCTTSAFDIFYYDGTVASLRMGCGFLSGEWRPAGE